MVLHCQTSAGATEERVDEISEAIGKLDRELRGNERKDTLSSIIPAEAPGLDHEEITRDAVHEPARGLDIDGRSELSKEELIGAVDAHQSVRSFPSRFRFRCFSPDIHAGPKLNRRPGQRETQQEGDGVDPDCFDRKWTTGSIALTPLIPEAAERQRPHSRSSDSSWIPFSASLASRASNESGSRFSTSSSVSR